MGRPPRRDEPTLIVGLGNPGAEYDRTRHNVGFEVIERLSAELRGRKEQRLRGGILEQGRLRGRPLFLLRPTRYMNRSGGPTAEVARLNEIRPRRLLVVHDDLDLELGRLKIRTGGSSGGHNGVGDIIACLGTEAFPRLRLGIGRPPRGGAEHYVLEPFETTERIVADGMLDQAVEAARCWVSEGIQNAMNRYNAASLGEAGPEQRDAAEQGPPSEDAGMEDSESVDGIFPPPE